MPSRKPTVLTVGGCQNEAPDPLDEDAVEEAIQDIIYNDFAWNLSADTCDERVVMHLDDKPHPERGRDDVDGMVIIANKPGTILKTESEDLYNDLDDMAEEFRKNYDFYLPDDFDYKSHLCEFYIVRTT